MQVKIICIVLTLGILWIFGLFASKDAFATNQTIFTITWQNNGDAQSWIDYNIFEDKTSPFGQYNSGDLVLYYTGSSPALGFGEWVSVPAYSSVTVKRGPKTDYLPASSVYVSYLPWKYEDPDPRDVGCEDPVASLTAQDIDSSRGANDIHVVVGGSASYSCWIPSAPPPPPPPPPPLAPPAPTNLSRTPPGCSDGLYNVPFSWSISETANKTQLWINGSIIGDWNYRAGSATVANFSPGTNYTWDVQAGNDSGWSGWASGASFNVGVCNPLPTQPGNLRESQWCTSGDRQKPDVNFQWDAVAGMTGYAVYIWDPGGVIPAVWRNGGWAVQGQTNLTNYDFLDLPNYTGLTWGVESYNSRGSSGVSQWRDFTTKNCVPPTLTNLRLENEPPCSDGSYGTTADPFRIRFDVRNADKVELEIYRNGVLWINSIARDGVWIGGMSPGYTYTLGYNLVGLWNETTYTWRVRAENSVGSTNWDLGAGDGPWWNVHRCSPLAPNNLNTSVSVPCTDTTYSASFTWQLQNGSLLPTKTEFKIGSGGAVTSWSYAYYGPHSVSGFLPNTQYLWYVRFGNNYGWSDWREGWVPSFLGFGLPVCTFPDLAVTSLTTNKGEYAIGENVNVTVGIKNVSQEAAVGKYGNFHNYIAWEQNGGNVTAWPDCDISPPANALVLYTDFSVFTEPPLGDPFGPGETVTYNYTINSWQMPTIPGSYTIRAIADSLCAVTEAGEVPGLYQANNIKDLEIIVNLPPTNPASLTAAVSCSASNQPVINFSWTDSLYESGYYLDVHTQKWTGDTTPAGWGYKDLPANSTSFTWSAANLLSGDVTYPLTSKTYWWRLQAFNGSGSSAHIYPPNTTNPQGGGSFTTFDCKPDLQIFMVIPDGAPGEIVSAQVYPVNFGTGSTYPPGLPNAQDSDGDGFSDSHEDYMGTNKNSRCSATSTAFDENPDAWAPDLDDDQDIDANDYNMIVAKYTTKVGDPGWDPRYDVIKNGVVEVNDVVYVYSRAGKNCSTDGTFEVAINMDRSTIQAIHGTPPDMLCTDPKDAVVPVGPLGPGEALWEQTVPVTLPAPGSYIATAMVDSGCIVSESDESNNTGIDNYDLNGFDLSATFVGDSWNKRVFDPDETATAKVMITNVPPATKTPATFLGIWPGHSGEPALPKCGKNPPEPSNPPVTGDSQPVGELIAGFSYEIDISFNVGSTPGTFTANGYVMYDCSGDDYNWDNNLTGGDVGSINFTYTVVAGTWFETTGGDVGSAGTGNPSINVSQAPPTTPVARYQSDYLVAGLNLDSKVVSKRWRINNYGKPLMLGSPYAYMAERFLAKAKIDDNNGQDCVIPGGNRDGFNYVDATGGCSQGEAVFQGGSAPNGNNVIYFIDGNLRIKSNLALSNTGYSVIFIVSGDIIIETTVTRIDGVYIAGGTFHSTDSSGDVGAQLVVNGAVYATRVNLNRVLGGSLCPSGDLCDNQKTAAEKIVYDPKYLIALNDLLGSPGVSWKEVAP